MTNKEILERAIQKAINGGYRTGYKDTSNFVDDICDHYEPMNVNNVIFNHEFAKALWGSEGRTLEGLRCSNEEGVTAYWAYHLQRMVIATDLIKYLGDNI